MRATPASSSPSAQEALRARSSAPRCARWRAPRRRCRTCRAHRPAAGASSTRLRSGPRRAPPAGAPSGPDRSGAGSSSPSRSSRSAGGRNSREGAPCASGKIVPHAVHEPVDLAVASRGRCRAARGPARGPDAPARRPARSVEPHEPPNTTQRSMPSATRSRSRSATRCCVVLSVERGDGRRAAAAALVVEHDVEERGIVEAAVMRQAIRRPARRAGTRAARRRDCRTFPSASCASRRARCVPDRVRLDLRIEDAVGRRMRRQVVDGGHRAQAPSGSRKRSVDVDAIAVGDAVGLVGERHHGEELVEHRRASCPCRARRPCASGCSTRSCW